ncbi:hypothetical protein EQU24_13620 [Methylotuvimicrobium buryatense]|uniref:Uncharacterized protein n=1 Tax=Methylotuvimicrobium buryatense TaxID=95641 RepID=A0A4P9UP37_METBY|nr:hypothetical protein EQU24_13620 [Methylotuvimicrobium buryatense]
MERNGLIIQAAFLAGFTENRTITQAAGSAKYTFRTSNFGSARGGAGVSGKGFASMGLARVYMDVFAASFIQILLYVFQSRNAFFNRSGEVFL